MLEIVVYSLFANSLVQTAILGSWMHWQQSVEANQNEEEDILTQYESKENTLVVQQANGSSEQQKDPRLMGWEFKIVRANRNLFRDPVVLQSLCDEEAEAGWIMLEKFDDCRVRFKRPIALREVIKAEFLNYDPYRCYYGSSWQPLNWFGAIAAMIALILPAYLGYTLVSQTLASSSQTQIPATFPRLDQPSRAWGDEVGVPSED